MLTNAPYTRAKTDLVVVLMHGGQGSIVADPQVNRVGLVAKSFPRQRQKWIDVFHQPRKLLSKAVVLLNSSSAAAA